MQEICSLVTTMTKGTRLLHAVGLAIVVVRNWNLESHDVSNSRKQKLTEGAKVQVLVPCHPANPGLPPAVLVVPACMGKASSTRKITQPGKSMRVFLRVCSEIDHRESKSCFWGGEKGGRCG
jgi:hypothetical protein